MGCKVKIWGMSSVVTSFICQFLNLAPLVPIEIIKSLAVYCSICVLSTIGVDLFFLFPIPLF